MGSSAVVFAADISAETAATIATMDCFTNDLMRLNLLDRGETCAAPVRRDLRRPRAHDLTQKRDPKFIGPLRLTNSNGCARTQSPGNSRSAFGATVIHARSISSVVGPPKLIARSALKPAICARSSELLNQNSISTRVPAGRIFGSA